MSLSLPLPLVGIDPVTFTAQACASVQSTAGSADLHYFNITIFDVSHGDWIIFAHSCSPQINPESLVPKQILINQPGERKGFSFPRIVQTNPATSTWKPWRTISQICHHTPHQKNTLVRCHVLHLERAWTPESRTKSTYVKSTLWAKAYIPLQH